MQFSHPDYIKSLTDWSIPVHQINLYITQRVTDTGNSNLYRHLKNESCYYISHIRSKTVQSAKRQCNRPDETFLFFEASILPLGYNQPLIKWVMKTFSPGSSGQGTKLTTHLHLVTMLRMSGAPLPHMTSWHTQRQLYLPSTTQFHCFNYSGHNAAPLQIRILLFNCMIVLQLASVNLPLHLCFQLYIL